MNYKTNNIYEIQAKNKKQKEKKNNKRKICVNSICFQLFHHESRNERIRSKTELITMPDTDTYVCIYIVYITQA